MDNPLVYMFEWYIPASSYSLSMMLTTLIVNLTYQYRELQKAVKSFSSKI